MNTFIDYISAFGDLLMQGRTLPVISTVAPSGSTAGPARSVNSGRVVLIFSPHPDDECITGGVALRLQREANARVINIPVTFGSNTERRAARREELKNACAHLGFELPEDFQGLEKPEDVAQVLKQYRPQMIFFPHAEDWNGTHERVHQLVMDALPLANVDCLLVQTEFWRPMKQPNLMVELSVENVTALVEALSLHTGEVARNPYHLMLPAWMMDNVRRGGEVVGGQGGEVPDFTFATLYRASKWVDGSQQELFEGGRNLSSGENAEKLLNF